MVASLLKIISTGMQDERLQPPKDQPDLGGFYNVLVKAGRYGTQWARIEFDTKPSFGQSGIIRIPVQGEMVGRVLLVTNMPDIKTTQDNAYKARIPVKLYSANYTSLELVQDFKYVKSYSNAPPPAAPVPETSSSVLRTLIQSTGLTEYATNTLISMLNPNSAILYGSSVLYAYKKVYTMGPANVPIGDIDIAFSDAGTLTRFAYFLQNMLGPTCVIYDPTRVLQYNNPSIPNNFPPIDVNERKNYVLDSSSAPIPPATTGSLTILSHTPPFLPPVGNSEERLSGIHYALGGISGTNYTNALIVLIYLPGKTPIQLVLCNQGLIAGRTLTEYIQQTMDFTVISGTFDGTTLSEPFSNDIANNIAVYTEPIPQSNFDWMLYRLQKFIGRGYTVYFQNQQQIDDWNALPNRYPLWGATASSSTVCPFTLVDPSHTISPDLVAYIPSVPYVPLTKPTQFTGIQLDDLYIGGTYSLTFTIPAGSQCIFSSYVTELGLSQPVFNLLNTDTFMLASPNQSSSTDPFLCYSYDGVTWNNIIGSGIVSTIEFGHANCIEWNGSIWVAVGNWAVPGNIIISLAFSSDGIHWSDLLHPVGASAGFGNSIVWNGSIWVGVGQWIDSNNTPIGSIIYSRNGTSYTITGPPGNGIGYGVAWNGSMFVAVGTWPQGTITTSLDGISWTTPIDPANLAVVASRGNSVAWNGSLWVVLGRWDNIQTGQPFGSMTTSADGITWSVPIFPPGVIYGGVTFGTGNGVAWNGYMWIAVGSWAFQNGGIGTITTSLDGITWTTPTNPADQTLNNGGIANSIKWNGSLWIVSGQWANPLTGLTVCDVATSPDGINWTISLIGNLQEYFGIQAYGLGTRRKTAFIGNTLFTPAINGTSSVLPYGTVTRWASDPTYKNGTQYFNQLYNTAIVNMPTFTFTATQRTMWLTFGTYYNSPVPVTITLNLVAPTNPTVVSDLVGPQFGWTNSLGHSLVNQASISIGGVKMDTIPGRLMEIIDEFQTPLEKVNETSRQLCRKLNGFNVSSFGRETTSQAVVTHLPFWFSKGDPGCFLPIDALYVDEVRVTVEYNPITSLYYTGSRAIDPAGKVISTGKNGSSLWPMTAACGPTPSKFYYQDPSGVRHPGLGPGTYSPFPNLAMPATVDIQSAYLLVEYIYLDKPEANRFRIADIQVPIVQHYTFDPQDTNSSTSIRFRLVIPNPTRDLYFYCQRYEAAGFNAHFLGTRDLSNNLVPIAPWWPDATGLDDHYTQNLKPGFSTRNSEPIRWLSLDYSETLNRYSTENVALFRSLLPSLEQRKAPFINRYFYNLPFGSQNGFTPFSMPIGEANLDKVLRLNLSLRFHGKTTILTDDFVERYIVHTFAQTYNIFRVYGGRGAMMFAY